MHSTFDTTNTTSALCTYIASNTIASGTGTTKSATAETTAQQINLGTPPQSQVIMESDAILKRDHRGNAQTSDSTEHGNHGVDARLQQGVCSKTGGRSQYNHRPLGDANRKSSHDHRSRRTSTTRKDAFTPANDALALGNKTDDFVGLPLHDDSIKIRATTEEPPLNRDNRQGDIASTASLGLGDHQYKDQMQKTFSQVEGAKQPDLDFTSTESLRSCSPSRDLLTTVNKGQHSLRRRTFSPPRAQNPTELSNSVDVVLKFDPPSSTSPLACPPAEKPGCGIPETRHHRQRRFDGQRQPPHTAKWIAQRIQEEDSAIAVGILSAWTRQSRRLEASEAAVGELNALADTEVVEALQELRNPKHFVRTNKGNKLETRVILTVPHNSTSLETTALIDSGCTGSTINVRFVKKNNLPTRSLPRPIPVYNADGTLNANGAITQTCKLRMVIQDHVEEINFAVSDIGNSDVYIGHDWLKRHNPSVNWKTSQVLMNRCPHTCEFITSMDIDEEEPDIQMTSIDEEDPASLEEGDRLFVLDVDGYLEANRTNYDYVLKYDPNRAESKVWTDIVPKQYHDFEDIFTKKDFDKLPE